MATINLKVTKTKLEQALTERLKQIKSDKANSAKLEQKYDASVEAWKRKVVTSLPKTQKPYDVNVGLSHYGETSGKTIITITYHVSDALPKPEREFATLSDWEYRQAVSEIESSLRILALSDEELVSTSTYKSVAKYL
jgi:hypothetical protein